MSECVSRRKMTLPPVHPEGYTIKYDRKSLQQMKDAIERGPAVPVRRGVDGPKIGTVSGAVVDGKNLRVSVELDMIEEQYTAWLIKANRRIRRARTDAQRAHHIAEYTRRRALRDVMRLQRRLDQMILGPTTGGFYHPAENPDRGRYKE